MYLKPDTKPTLDLAAATEYLKAFDVSAFSVKLLGIRPKGNDIGSYDDTIAIVSPDHFSAYNANTDPSRMFKNVAVLKAGGPYLYKIGLHNMKHPYKALRQYGRVTVLRDGVPHTDTAQAPFYIDIHKGGYGTTSSLGCQTIWPEQWPKFLETVERELKIYNQSIIPYCLIEL